MATKLRRKIEVVENRMEEFDRPETKDQPASKGLRKVGEEKFEVEVEVFIDHEKIAKEMGAKAFRNQCKYSRASYIRVTVVASKSLGVKKL